MKQLLCDHYLMEEQFEGQFFGHISLKFDPYLKYMMSAVYLQNYIFH